MGAGAFLGGTFTCAVALATLRRVKRKIVRRDTGE
jgi:hypothetical protein